MIEAVWEGLAGLSVLVTGASGFIGSVLCAALVRVGADVHATSRTPLVQPGVPWHGCDLADLEATRQLFRRVRPQVVLHLASHVAGTRTPDAVLPTFHNNLTSTMNVLLVAREMGCQRVVLTGSCDEPEPSDDWSVPCSPYAAAKHAAGAYGRMFHALYDLPVTTLRVFMVYGPGQRHTTKVVPYVITSFLKGEAPRLSSGTREVDWVYVDDVVDAFACAATAPDLAGATVDVGSGSLVTLREVVEHIHELMRPGATPHFGGLTDRPMEQSRVADVEATVRRMGWRPQVTLLDGLSRTVAWYQAKMLDPFETHREAPSPSTSSGPQLEPFTARTIAWQSP
ncbi:MAG: NAD-dependent epimerase/dehydratase family protein [Nocardioidaceae bacterium]